MSTANKNVITDWKRLWQLVSGIHFETPERTVLDELINVSKELQDGLLQFKPKRSSDIQLEKLLYEKKQDKLLPFTRRLQDLLDLESSQCWEILCYYLTKEYRGSASFLTTLISTESNMSTLLDDIAGYYSLERMIVLKIVKNLLLFYDVPNHPYHHEYKTVIDKLTLKCLRDSYLAQLEYLINQNVPSILESGEFFNHEAKLVTWAERNAREINEVLHILLLIWEHLPPELIHVRKLFACFKQHLFGKQNCYLDASNSYHNELMKCLTYSEVILAIKCLDFDKPQDDIPLVNGIIDELELNLFNMCHCPEHGPLLFVWMLLGLRANMDQEDESNLRRYRQFGKRALTLNCFEFLLGLVKHTMFNDESLVSRIVRKTIYNQLSHMCDLFDGDGSCARHNGIYELLCELLSWPQHAKEFCSTEEGGVRSLYNTLLEVFPLNFKHISMLAYALTKAGQGNYIKTQLESMPIFTEIYDEHKHKLRAITDDEYVLLQEFSPFPRIDFMLKAGTTVAVMTRPEGCCVHFRVPINFFNVLHHEINCLLTETTHVQEDFDCDQRIQHIEAGMKYLEIALQHAKSLSAISVEMVHPTEMCIDIINKFRYAQCPPIRLLAYCLRVCTALLPLVDNEIFTRVINLNVLPVISNNSLDFRKLANGVCFDARLLGSYIDDVEKKYERYDFLRAYLSFLRTYSKLQRTNYMQVEIPGLIFILRDVFPNIHTWRFKNQLDKNKIYFEILSFICDTLDSVSNSRENYKKSEFVKQRKLLRDICVYTLLNLENGLILLRFVGLGNASLQHTMEMESNWMLHQPHSMMMLVRLAMRILMHLLQLRQNVFNNNEVSPLETLIYTQPKQRDSLRIIPIVTSYMCNIFDRWLPILSCRLLRRIALEFNMSLLACLDMEPDQIRLIFLQRLPDEFESDTTKIAILELVDACIEKQPGVTEAFFKVNYATEKRSFFGKECSPQISDSILTYMEEYLNAVESDPKTVDLALPCKIMNIFHSLWKQNLQMLVEKLLSKPTFWKKLCSPFFSELRPNVRIYTQLMNILAIEVFSTSEKKQVELKQVLSKFFERRHFESWLAYVFDIPRSPVTPETLLNEETPDWICRLQAFKDFIFILLKKQPQIIELPTDQIKLLAQKCLQALVSRSEYVQDMRPFILLAELYLFILLSYKHSYTKTDEEARQLLQQLLQLFGRIGSCYGDLHVRAKEACLSIIIKCAQLHAEVLIADSDIAFRFLNVSVNIICTELQYLENSVNIELELVQSGGQHVSVNTLLLSLNLLKTIATIFQQDGPVNWDLPFVSARLFLRLLSCTSNILQIYHKQNLSIQLLDVLVVLAKGHCSAEFLHCDVAEYFWLNLLPPRELLQVKYEFTKPSTDVWTAEKWWPIYARGIEFATILYQKHSNFFLKSALQFVGIHELYIVDVLLLGKQSLEPPAMNLIKSAITFIAELSNNHKEWREDHAQSLYNIMRAVQGLMGHSITMYHQPKNLRSLVAGRRLQLDLTQDNESRLAEEIVNAYNDLTEILILCVKALEKFSPDLISLLCEPVFETGKWETVFEVHFGAPKLNENAVPLTFGLVLSVVSVFTKVLNLQNYGFSELPLNSLPEVGDKTSVSDRIIPASRQNPTVSPNRNFSKSISTTSASSALACPSNELLANLDSELCLIALEHVLMLAASQAIYSLKCSVLDTREMQLIRREISSELLTFHDFVRRKVIVDYREQRSMYKRRKHGQVLVKRATTITHLDTAAAGTSGTQSRDSGRRTYLDLGNSMRVNVVRRLHLQQQQRTPTPNVGNFEMSHVISPITNTEADSALPAAAANALSSTPNLSRPPTRRPCETVEPTANQEHGKRSHLADARDNEEDVSDLAQEDSDEIQYFQPDELNFTSLSFVQLVEEDYLHFMSNIFNVICQNE